MRRATRQSRGQRAAFTLMELQVAVVLLAFGLATLASLLTTQSRVLSRLRGNFKTGATVCVTHSNDPWVTKINTAARITAEPIVQSTPPTVTAWNAITIVSHENDLSAESLTVTADVTEIP